VLVDDRLPDVAERVALEVGSAAFGVAGEGGGDVGGQADSVAADGLGSRTWRGPPGKSRSSTVWPARSAA
jgi:hypothetical protein